MRSLVRVWLIKGREREGKGKGKENGLTMGSSGSESKVVENGVVNSVEGPPLETFVTAADELPTHFAVGGS
jgi:hypothetical protein